MPHIVSLGHTRPTVGDFKTSIYSNDHLGWLKCDGREVEIGDFRILQDVIGTSFGGSGTKFMLPDSRGRVEGVIGSGTGLTSRSMGDSVGAETHILTTAQLPSHTHTATTSSNGNHTHGVTDNGHTHGMRIDATDDNNFTAQNNQDPVADSSNFCNVNFTTSNTTGITGLQSNGEHSHTFTTNSTGGGGAHNNMQPTLFVGNMFIYSGVPTYGDIPF